MTIEREYSTITRVARSHGVDPAFMAAVRVAENGRPGREFGVMLKTATTFEAQLSVAVKTIRNYLARCPFNPLTKIRTAQGHDTVIYSRRFVDHAATIWAPVGARNDPTGLNRNWPQNVWYHYKRFVQRGTVT